MKKILYKIVNSILTPFYGKVKFQRLFWTLYNFGIQGLNLRNCNIYTNGELFFINELNKFYSKTASTIVIFDIGANIGNYTEILAENFKSVENKIYCFEPLPKAYEKLHERFEERRNVITNNFALGSISKHETIFASSENAETASLYRKSSPLYSNDYKLTIDIEIRNLIEFCKKETITKINFLKLDVEGSEFDIINGNFTFIKNCDFFQFEFGPPNIYSKIFFNDYFTVLKNDFEIFRLLRNGLERMDRYIEDYEIFVLGNYIAINKKITNTIPINWYS